MTTEALQLKRPNPLPPDQMNPAERRAELCSLLALGLVRLHQREIRPQSDSYGESSLHFPPDQSVHANPTHPGEDMA